jgi:hypothetical protein
MSSLFMFKRAVEPAATKKAPKLSALELVVARFAREHDDHVAPIVGCYLCLHNEPRTQSRELPVAA